MLVAGDAVDRDLRERPSAVATAELVRGVAETLHVRGGDRVRATTDRGARTLVTVRSQLRLALRCILDNALRFSAADERVNVTTRREGDVRGRTRTA